MSCMYDAQGAYWCSESERVVKSVYREGFQSQGPGEVQWTKCITINNSRSAGQQCRKHCEGGSGHNYDGGTQQCCCAPPAITTTRQPVLSKITARTRMRR
jgi:hypothetical protein